MKKILWLIPILALVLFASCGKSPEEERAVMKELADIGSAKEQWALEAQKKNGDTVLENEIAPYIKGSLKHPWGGKYIINPIGKAAESTKYGTAQQ